MTCIAYKAGVMAGEGLLANSAGSVVTRTAKKIRKLHSGVLAGFTGDIALQESFFEWAANPNGVWTAGRDAGFVGYGLIASEYEPLRMVDQNCVAFEIGSEYAAIGTGSDIALGAMTAGGTPIDAVKAAIQHDIYCGGEISFVMLDSVERKVIELRERQKQVAQSNGAFASQQ